MVVIKMISESDRVAVVSLIASVNECMNEELKAMIEGDVQSYLDWNKKRFMKDAELREIVDRNITSKSAVKKQA